MNLFVVDSHHKVLSAWAKYRRTLPHAPRLLTLDHHTDTSKPFRNYFKNNLSHTSHDQMRKLMLSEIHFSDSTSIDRAIEKLSNDEHVVAAIETDIISSAFVIAHNARDTDISVYREHKIVCSAVDEKSWNLVLESSFLKARIEYFNKTLNEAKESLLLESEYILDIDLDYFNTLQSIAPKETGFFQNLFTGAGLVTIATEPEYVKSCALDPRITSEYLLEHLNLLFKK